MPRTFGIDIKTWIMNRGAVFWILCIAVLLVFAYWQVQRLFSQSAQACTNGVYIVVIWVGILMCIIFISLSIDNDDSAGKSDAEALE